MVWYFQSYGVRVPSEEEAMRVLEVAGEVSGGSVASSVKGLLLATYNRGLRKNLHIAEKSKGA